MYIILYNDTFSTCQMVLMFILDFYISGPLMFQVLYKNFTELDYRIKVSDLGGSNVGFPYSLLLYALTFAMVIGILALTVKQVIDHLREKDRLHSELKVRFDRLKLEYDAEVDAFKRYRQRQHLRPESGGSYRGDRRSTGSHSPRLSREIRDHDREHRRRDDHSPRRPDDFSYGRHSPRPRDRSPPREYSHGNHSPRPHSRNHSPSRHDYGRHSPRNRSPRPDENRTRRHSPQRNNPSSNNLPVNNGDRAHSPRNVEDHDNPALIVTPPIETPPKLNVDTPAGQDLVNENVNIITREGAEAKTEDIELTVSNLV